jgi:hypothetical protein
VGKTEQLFAVSALKEILFLHSKRAWKNKSKEKNEGITFVNK